MLGSGMANKGDEAQSEWQDLQRLVSQKNGKRVGDQELRWDEDLTGNRVLVLNVVAASFVDLASSPTSRRVIRFTAQPQLKSMSPSIHVQIGKTPAPVAWSLSPSSKASKFAWVVHDDEIHMQKTLTTAELSDAVETTLVQYHPPPKT
jgi:hypothetical protein